MPRTDREINRRDIIQGVGAAGVIGLAGCIGDDGDDSVDADDDSVDADDTPADTDDDDPVDSDEIYMGGELIVGSSENIADFDPININDTTSAMGVRTLIYEGLTITDFEGQVHPALAEDWEQIDDTTFEFYLREGVQFHNGEEVHAEQVKRSYERYEGQVREPDVYDWYESSEVIDDLTIEINLSRPDATFLSGLSVPILPDELLDGDTDPDERPIGTGPYQYDEFRDDELFRVRRFEDYWFEGDDEIPGEAPIEEITFRIIREDAARSSALQTGDVHMAYGLTADSLDDFDASEEFNVTHTTSGGYDFMAFPVQFEPWDNATLRRGVDYLIPRPIIVEEVYQNWAVEAGVPIAPLGDQMDIYIPPDFREQMLEEYGGYDIEAGIELIEEAFEEEGIEAPMEMHIATNADNDDRVQWVELIAESMEQTGLFEMEMETYEWTDYVTRTTGEGSETNNEINAIGLSAGFDPDSFVRATAHEGNFSPGCCNIHHYSNDDLNELMDDARFDPDIAFDDEARGELYQDIVEILLQENPVSYIQFGSQVDVTRAGEVHGWQTHPINGSKIRQAVYAPASRQVSWMDPDA